MKTFVALAVTVYFLNAAAHPGDWRFIDGVNLLMHEASHLIFYFFGEFLSVAGGSFMQLAIPFLFAAYFFLRKEFYSASLVLFWAGESLLNVSVYVADAELMRLELLGEGIHDWNYMLGRLGLLEYAGAVGGVFWVFGTCLILIAAACSLATSRNWSNTAIFFYKNISKR